MALKHLLLNLESGDDAVPRIDIATQLAKAHEAHVTGLFIRYQPPVRPIPGAGAAGLPDELRGTLRLVSDTQKQAEAEMLEAFKGRTAGAGVSADCCIEDGVEANGTINRLLTYARTADLAILGKSEAGAGSMVHDLLFGSGVPVVVVPRSAPREVGRHVAVAWNGSREAARAVNDAMPILERAAKVTVLCVDPQRGRNESPAGDLIRHLGYHDVEARAESIVRGGLSVGDALIARLADFGADLLVMGGWGHSRLREFVLGGVTKRILEQTSVPVLMSH